MALKDQLRQEIAARKDRVPAHPETEVAQAAEAAFASFISYTYQSRLLEAVRRQGAAGSYRSEGAAKVIAGKTVLAEYQITDLGLLILSNANRCPLFRDPIAYDPRRYPCPLGRIESGYEESAKWYLVLNDLIAYEAKKLLIGQARISLTDLGRRLADGLRDLAAKDDLEIRLYGQVSGKAKPEDIWPTTFPLKELGRFETIHRPLDVDKLKTAALAAEYSIRI